MRILSVIAVAAILAGSTACRSSNYYVSEGDRWLRSNKQAEAVLAYRKAIQKDSKSAEAYYKLGLAQRRGNENGAAFDSFLHATSLNPEFVEAQAELGDLYLGSYLTAPVKNASLYEKIARIADWLLAKDPKSFAGLRLRGYLAINDKKPDQALDCFHRAEEIRPRQPDIALGLTQGLLLSGRFDDARRTALEFIDYDKTFGPIYDVLYAYEMSAGRVTEAEAILRHKVANNPLNQDFKIQLAEHCWRQSKKNDAFKLLDGLLGAGARPESYTRVEEFYRRAGEWDRALAALEQGLNAYPQKKMEYRQRKAAIIALAGRPNEAIGILEDLLREQPSATEARKMRAVLLLNSTEKGQRERALPELEALAKASSDDSGIRFQLARAYAANGMTDEARREFEALLRTQPKNAAVLLGLAELTSRSKQFQQSSEYSERVLAIDAKNRNARLLHATSLVGLGRIPEANNEYKALVSDEPRFTEAALQLALLNVEQKRFKEAEKLFRETYRAQGTDFRGLKGLVEVYAAQGDWKKAVATVASAIDRDPNAAGLHSLLASTAARGNQPELAIQEYEWIVERQPDALEAYLALGQLYQRQRNLAQSAAALGKARDLAPKEWRNWARLAIVQQEAGEREAAGNNYRRALQLGADDPHVWNNLAYLEAEIGSNLDDALTLAGKALARSPTNPQFADTMGFVYLKKRNTATALDVFQKLSSKYPNEAVFRYHLALALLESGDQARGEQQLKKALAADPTLATIAGGKFAP